MNAVVEWLTTGGWHRLVASVAGIGWWPVPQSALDRHSLSDRFNVAPEALPLVRRVGLDRVLSSFETIKGVHAGTTLVVGFGLQAYFGFDPEKPIGECCYVNITVLR